MGALAGFVRHPQTVWVRRALFQLHLWVGLATGVYIFVISLSGSLIVFRRELDRALCPPTLIVSPSGRRVLSLCEPAFISWVAEFHDHLGGGRTGLLINGLGAVAVIAMCVTGAVIWWPGRSRWRRSLTLHRGVTARRFIWDLHSALGFWVLLLIIMWAATALYFAFPGPFNALSDLLSASGEQTRASQLVDDAIVWLVRLHFGRTFGPVVETLWVLLGLAPCALFISGAIMWWNRVLRTAMGDSGKPVTALIVKR
jgi:uncharacterized iron-regulated membrane protein